MTKQILADQSADRLAEAIELIRNPQDWCQGGMGKGKDGLSALPWADWCIQRCALGSIIAVSRGHEDPVYHLAASTLDLAAHGLTPGYGTISTNDQFPAEKAHAKVMEMFPIAIERLRSQAAQHKLDLGLSAPAAVWSAEMQTNYASA